MKVTYRDTHLHFDTDEVDPRAPISRKEARRLNQEAEDDRGIRLHLSLVMSENCLARWASTNWK